MPAEHAAGKRWSNASRAACEQYFEDLDGARPHALFEMVTQAVERPLLQFAMARAAGNQSAAAELLGINRNTLRKKLVQHKIT